MNEGGDDIERRESSGEDWWELEKLVGGMYIYNTLDMRLSKIKEKDWHVNEWNTTPHQSPSYKKLKRIHNSLSSQSPIAPIQHPLDYYWWKFKSLQSNENPSYHKWDTAFHVFNNHLSMFWWPERIFLHIWNSFDRGYSSWSLDLLTHDVINHY